jgi:hypothetical protein
MHASVMVTCEPLVAWRAHPGAYLGILAVGSPGMLSSA